MEIGEALRKFTYGVYVIGAPGPNYPNFMTAAWVVRLSEEPPLVGVAVANEHYTCELLNAAGPGCVFGLSVLGQGRGQALAKACGSVSGRQEPKLSEGDYKFTRTGAPVLVDSVVYLACRLKESVPVGDHTLFIAEAICAHEGERSAETPLGRREGKYF
ncbi:MAG: flavin reductase family protein [Betaproteobacteria bacterium]